ncbi:MAG TPA: DUF445 domain-containing protein, partial [Alphaproteobacteria bacterium]|nr:DUF445 domain-containing protein [Alphaproteobacteria bacterium]
IVGGLADWFAVTALFRRPLGLPIPHTAIVPRQKERVGAWLGTFVVDNFLASHALARELRALDLIGRIAGWLAVRANAARVADRIIDVVPHIFAALDDRDMRRLVATTFGNRIEDSDIASILSKVLRSLVAKDHHRAILARALPALHAALREGEPALYSAIERRLWFLPKRLDKYLASQLLNLIQDAISDLSQPGSPTLARAEQYLVELAGKLEQDERVRARVHAGIRTIVRLPEIQAWLSTVWDEIRQASLDDIASANSRFRRIACDSTMAFGESLTRDKELADRLTGLIEGAVGPEHVSWRARVAKFIAEQVRGWDTAEFTRRMELWAGRELQYIRINGTLLGFLIGVALFLISHLARA